MVSILLSLWMVSAAGVNASIASGGVPPTPENPAPGMPMPQASVSSTQKPTAAPDIRFVSAAPVLGSSVHASTTTIELTFSVTSPETGDYILFVYPDALDPTNRFFCAVGASNREHFTQGETQIVRAALNQPIQRWDARCPLPRTTGAARVSLADGYGWTLFDKRIPLAYTWVPEPVATAPAQSPPSPSLEPVRVGGAIKQPTKIKDAKPVYPAVAQSARVQGVVIIDATIDPTGKVGAAKVLRSIPLLDEAAVAAVKQWEFTPTIVDGVARSVIMTVTVNFTLGLPAAALPANAGPVSPSRAVTLTALTGENGARYVFEITSDRAAKLPRWDSGPQEPPLSTRDAHVRAMTWIRGRATQAEAFELASSSLVRSTTGAPQDPALWYYGILFDRIVGGRRLSGGVDSMVVVLLDGSIVEPRVVSPSARPLPDGVYRPGNGVTFPVPISQPRPSYTSAAMKAKIQGPVVLEAIVRPDGTVGEVTVIRSLDSVYGLDAEAIATAKKWRFRPGTKDGLPVSIQISLELTFTLK